ncbi:class I SAM-dependent methyltransferase [Sporomusa termitida]|uniref:Ubiquinone/menaquinone biosynthesis C-methyltransferase UbiE n=1 Tax=Sporomusa termitida TaxID=2377 RepID=A0A517DPR3_9FIRM|nr:class I SAM-dependent methyltransferase [Sporomusa termitida]QDR79342.1 Ubiquinone/menaquinone biosynthesis C-methyltransferase UbiE [Sporomusa termitida]
MDSKKIFSDKVNYYVKYRPQYPNEFIEYLINGVGVSPASIVADVGAGTGIFTKLLAGKVKTIYAVEPNPDMRAACVEYCRGYKNFVAVDGSAEETSLPGHSVDFVTVAQAFHWFDAEKAKNEFQRILKPHGKVILVWNRDEENDFAQEYGALRRKLFPDSWQDGSNGNGKNPAAYRTFFREGKYDAKIFKTGNTVSLEQFIGASLSTSYAPSEKDEKFPAFIDGLTALFAKYSQDGQIRFRNHAYSYVGEV